MTGPPPQRAVQCGTLQALLAGFAGVGLDEARIAARCALPDLTGVAFDVALPGVTFASLWEAAFAQRAEPELPTRVGLAVPFGAFRAVDYLAGSSPRVDAGFASLAAWFRQVTADFRVEVSDDGDGGGVVRLVARDDFAGRATSDEFTLAVMIGRFGSTTLPAVRPRAVRLVGAPPAAPTAHAALLGATVTFGCAVSAVEWSPAAWRAPLRTADPALEATLRALVPPLALGVDDDGLEAALRARLRDLLPDGDVSASQAARALGLSPRTLQRQLGARGASFRAVLDAFREAEAERLLTAGAVGLAEVALRLGFSDQTAWNRAFRRWKGQSPRAWLAARRARG